MEDKSQLLEACKIALDYFMNQREKRFVDIEEVEPIEKLLQQAIERAER